jgi:hypothetical protein
MTSSRQSSVIKGQNVRRSDQSTLLAETCADQKATVRVRKEDDVVREIIVECACGSVVRVECRYDGDKK